MPKLLLEYKGAPVVLNHRLKKIDKIFFITVYTTGYNDYERRDFEALDDALDFKPENGTLKLVFVYIKSEENGVNYVIYQSINFINNRLMVDNLVSYVYKGFRFDVEFGLESFRLKKVIVDSKARGQAVYDINYTRRKTVKTGTYKRFELQDLYYQIFPQFEDIFLEALFMLDLMTRNYAATSKIELEAFFLQGKSKIENKPIIGKEYLPEINTKWKETNEHLELSNLIGLDKIKVEIEELKALALFRKKRIELGLPVTPSTMHMVFTGNPGTGKTTVARLLGQIYFDIGLLASNKVVEVSRGDLVGEYVGHTAPKTQKVFERALGGILFIDEAYSLFKSVYDFGNEAVETLLKLMEDNREKIVVIIAGYPREIEDLLTSNPGLKSRFSKTLHFDDYSKKELAEIFNKMVSDYHNNMSEEATRKLESLIDRYYGRGLFTSNARAVRNLFEETIKRQSARLSKMANPTEIEITTFTDIDIPGSLH